MDNIHTLPGGRSLPRELQEMIREGDAPIGQATARMLALIANKAFADDLSSIPPLQLMAEITSLHKQANDAAYEYFQNYNGKLPDDVQQVLCAYAAADDLEKRDGVATEEALTLLSQVDELMIMPGNINNPAQTTLNAKFAYLAIKAHEYDRLYRSLVDGAVSFEDDDYDETVRCDLNLLKDATMHEETMLGEAVRMLIRSIELLEAFENDPAYRDALGIAREVDFDDFGPVDILQHYNIPVSDSTVAAFCLMIDHHQTERGGNRRFAVFETARSTLEIVGLYVNYFPETDPDLIATMILKPVLQDNHHNPAFQANCFQHFGDDTAQKIFSWYATLISGTHEAFEALPVAEKDALAHYAVAISMAEMIECKLILQMPETLHQYDDEKELARQHLAVAMNFITSGTIKNEQMLNDCQHVYGSLVQLVAPDIKAVLPTYHHHNDNRAPV